ncbi:hypothetical protein QAD02_019172 [Eretmocerus hayati]|uniref:Uncharacterized protein n=1 Tax=Eretmocerus hayati TaxID=131215 RepID=A0ACC2PIG4_9HYME|nr:hypothetical protein QAD02_019172 [Eretmocerus hayati]
MLWQLSVEHADVDLFDLLISHGAEKNHVDGKSNLIDICISSMAFYSEIIGGDITPYNEVLRRLTTDQEFIDELFQTKIIPPDVYRFGDVVTLTLLVSKGFLLSTLSIEDKPHLHIAAENKNPNILTYLVKHLNQDVNQMNYFNETAMHIAARNEKLDHIRTLVSLGGDPNIVNRINYAPLRYTVNDNGTISASFEYLINLTSFPNIVNVFNYVVCAQNLSYAMSTIKFIVPKFMISENFQCIRNMLRRNFRYGITYLNECQTELARAASSYLHGHMTFADLLYLKRFDSRCKIGIEREDVDSPEIFEKFPIYGGQILNTYLNVSDDIDCAEISIDKLCKISEFRYIYPEEAFYKIFSYLTFQELQNLSKA